MILVDHALNIIHAARPQFPALDTALDQACGRIAAADIYAALTVPPFDGSAMDGFAVQASSAPKGARLKVIGEAPAGAPFAGTVGDGEAVRIFTGSVMPRGADAVVIQENVTRDGDFSLINVAAVRGAHIRKAGQDFALGEKIISAGTRLGPAHIALAAAANLSALPCRQKPMVALLASGDELRAPGSALADGQIVNSNPFGLRALLEGWGAQVIDLGIAGDTMDSVHAHVTAAARADIIVPIGGASVGDYDVMKPAFAQAGFEMLFDKIAVKPGKPTWLARRGAQMALGLPGNPASAFVCAHLFLKPLLGFSDGLDLMSLPLAAPLGANGPRENFLRGQITVQGGALILRAFENQDSALIAPLAVANALIRRPANGKALAAGEQAPALLLGPLELS